MVRVHSGLPFNNPRNSLGPPALTPFFVTPLVLHCVGIRLFGTALHIMYNYVCNGTILQTRISERARGLG
jgi:hypothetical protein